MQETRVWSLVLEDHTSHGETKPMQHCWAHELQLLKQARPRARSPQREKPPRREAHAPQLMRNLPLSTRESLSSSQDPAQPNNKQKIKALEITEEKPEENSERWQEESKSVCDSKTQGATQPRTEEGGHSDPPGPNLDSNKSRPHTEAQSYPKGRSPSSNIRQVPHHPKGGLSEAPPAMSNRGAKT